MKLLRDMRVMTRLMLFAGVMCLIVGFVGAVGLSEISDMRTVADEMYHHELLGSVAAQEVDVAVLKVLETAEHALAHYRTTPGVVTTAREHIKTYSDELYVALAKLDESNMKHGATETERKIVEEVPLFLGAADKLLADLEATKSAGSEEVRKHEETLIAHEESLDRLTHDLSAARSLRAAEEDLQATAIFDSSRNFMLLFTALAVLVGLGLAWVVARSVSVPLNQTVELLDDVAAGNLTATLDFKRNDELGRMATALNKALRSMRIAMSEVRTAAVTVAGTAEQLQAAAQDISSGSQEQASGLEEAAASLEEMAEAIRQNASGAEKASDVSLESRRMAEKGGHVVAQAVEAMTEANTASQRIAQIIGTIDEIAFQTNLLALNAAVEAARAGEQGRGFAVVAAEVGNLAQRSAGAAKEIKELIHNSVERVENGARLVNQSGESLEAIVESVTRVTDLVGEIASASKEQSIGVDHVNTAVVQADRVTQGNAAQTEELSGSAEALAMSSQQLLSMVSRFRLDVEGEHAPVLGSRKTAPPMLTMHRGRSGGPSGVVPRPLEPTGTDGFEEF